MDTEVRLFHGPLVRVTIAALCLAAVLHSGAAHAQVRTVDSDGSAINISSQYCQTWQDDGEEILVLRGDCRVANASVSVTGPQMVIWRRPDDVGERVVLYGEQVRISRPGSTRNEPGALLELTSPLGVTATIPSRLEKPARHEPFFKRALAFRRRGTPGRPAVTSERITVARAGAGPLTAWQPTPENVRRVQIRSRTSAPFELRSDRSNDTVPPEQLIEVTGGVNVLIDGLTTDVQGRSTKVGLIDLSADRMVIWTVPSEDVESGEFVQTRDTPLQVYMEGNIEIRQSGNILTATHAFVDVQRDRALLLNGELKAYLPRVDGQVRVRAERLRQVSRNRFHAKNAWVSTSPFGKPGYRLQASDIFVAPRSSKPWIKMNGRVDPDFGLPSDETLWIDSRNNTFFVGDVPVLAFPRFSAPAEDPGIPLRRATVAQDRIFGLQVKTVWDLTRVLGAERPEGLNWNLHADYLSQRGPAVGSSVHYEGVSGSSLLPGPYEGEALLYYIRDTGTDDLGLDRRNLATESDNRGRASWRHRQLLPGNTTLFGELGYLSDRNYLEQYYENEFDEQKDVESLLRLKQDRDNWSWSLLGRTQLNDFNTTTEWLPRADLYGLSEPFFDGRMTWSSHSSIGYGQLRLGDAPTDPADTYVPLPYVANVEGLVAMTRHEVDAPFNLGPVKIVPYAMGEVAHWDEDLSGSSVDRSVVSTGVRSSLQMSRIYPFVRSRIFNLNGLAHKIEYNLDYAWTDSSEDLSGLAQYNEIDDDAQERFRNRYIINTFGGLVPPQFGPRGYAVRSGAGLSVTAPWHELVDDQQVLRWSTRHRLQTRVGPATNPRIRDWVIWETGFSYFPDKTRDNFGEEFGLMFARGQWNVGERTSLIAGGLWDVFDDGQELWNVGVLSQRSRRGSVYVGYRSVKGGPLLDSGILAASFSYAMSPKWVATAGAAYDIAENMDRGQSMTLTRIGLDWLVHIGASYDRSKDNAGVAFMIEPRFGSTSTSPLQLNSLLGIR